MSDVPSAVAGVIEADTLCRRCGYNLRGLAPTGLCPECGTAIALSLVGNLLKQADPDWVERLRFGTALKLWNIALGIFVGLAAGMIVMAGLPRPLLTIIGIAGGAFGLWATFLITSQEPRIALQEDPITLRKALRACAAAAFVGGVISNVTITGSWAVVAKVVGAILGLVGMFVAWGELLYFRRFAHRIPDLKLAKSTTLLMWIGPIAGGVVIAFGLLLALTMGVASPAGTTGPPGSGTGVALGGGVCFFAAFVLYLVLWYVRLLTNYRKAFQSAASQSRASVLPSPSPPTA
jgi:hypothetical protein